MNHQTMVLPKFAVVRLSIAEQHIPVFPVYPDQLQLFLHLDIFLILFNS